MAMVMGVNLAKILGTRTVDPEGLVGGEGLGVGGGTLPLYPLPRKKCVFRSK